MTVAASPGQPIDVFISYSSADVALAERLEHLLKARGKRVWRDKTRLQPGQRVTNVIPEALREAKAVVTIWSDAAAASNWVKHETSYAEVADKLATLSTASFSYAKLASVYRDLHCDTIEAALADPTKLLQRIEYLADPARTRRVRIDISRMPTTYASRLFGREAEMADLNKAWDSAGAEKTNVVVLDAMGGTGKTALVNHFVQGLAAQGWRGAEAVFVWSFYSQGTDDKRQASADEFFATALAWFGHTGEAPKSQHDKGVRLAALIAAKRALVILDGLEPLQHGPSRRSGGSGDAGLTGALKDQGLRALLRQLAAANPGLIVVTTRLKVPDLAGRPAPAVINERLGPIPTKDGAELIRTMGVKGKHEELTALVEDLSGHAIALTQVATWLKNFRGGDVRCARDELPRLVDLGGDNERDPFRVMQTYETQFKREIAEREAKGDKPADIAAAKQLALLFLMGLFDRPMERGDREALLAEPVIPGVTDGLVGLTPGQIDYAVQGLRDLGLLLPKDEGTPYDLDAHPLVREYFGARLEKERPEVWKAAHGRLYDYYRFRGLPEAFREPITYGLVALKAGYGEHFDTLSKGLLSGTLAEGYRAQIPPSVARAEVSQLRAAAKLIDGPEWDAALAAFLPESEEAMAPLFAAIAHGCAAGLYTEVWSEVYWPRIARGNEQFAVHKLGLHGSNLAAIAHFFAEPFSMPAPGLSPAQRQALVLNVAGFVLRALGRLAEAVESMRVASERAAERDNWQNAGSGAGSLSELLVTLGRLEDDAAKGETGAVATGAQSVAYADRSGDAFQRMSNRTAHADALLQAGAWGDAAQRFAEAEAMQRERQPGLPLLYSLQGFQWCDLKLAQGRAGEVAARANHALDAYAGAGEKWLLDIALDTLSIGRAAHVAAIAEGGADITSGAPQLDAAVDGLRAAGSSDHLPRGLLARAAYHRDAGSDKLAAGDLTEAFEIAERGGMRLFLADCWLESARQQLARPAPTEPAMVAAAKALQTAAVIITKTGYKRRDPDLAFVGAELALAKGDAATGRRRLDAVIAAMRAHDLWSFLPQVVRLAERNGLTDLAPTIADLTAERARFDAEADAAFEQARKRADDLDDGVIDARLADPEFRRDLAAAMQANDMPALDTLGVAQQRDYARRYILQVERKREADAEREAPAEGGTDPDSIPDALVEETLGNADFRRLLDEMLVKSGSSKLADLDAADQRAAVRAMIEAMAQAEAETKPHPATEAAPPPPRASPRPAAAAPSSPAQPQPPTASKPAPRRGGILRRMFGPFMRRDT